MSKKCGANGRWGRVRSVQVPTGFVSVKPFSRNYRTGSEASPSLRSRTFSRSPCARCVCFLPIPALPERGQQASQREGDESAARVSISFCLGACTALRAPSARPRWCPTVFADGDLRYIAAAATAALQADLVTPDGAAVHKRALRRPCRRASSGRSGKERATRHAAPTRSPLAKAGRRSSSTHAAIAKLRTRM